MKLCNIFTKLKEKINERKYNIHIQKKLREYFKTEDGKLVLEWLIFRYLLNTTKANNLEYQQGKIDLVKELIIIANISDEELIDVEHN